MMRNNDLLRETKEFGEEKYTDNVKKDQCKCTCQKKGIVILKKKKTSEED